jgi:adenylosuccinate synthase
MVGLGCNPAGYVRQAFFSDRKINSLDQLAGMCDDFDGIQRKFFKAVQENGIIEPVVYEDSNGKYFIGEAMAIASSKFHKEKGATTGKPRICGLFDCVLHAEANQAQGPFLSISRIDGYDDYDNIGLVIAYVIYNPDSKVKMVSNGREYKNGDIIKAGDSVPCENVLRHCHPIVRVMDGWRDSPVNYQKRAANAPLPKQLQNSLGAIKYYTGAEIISIGNGQNTDNLIYLRQVG